MLLGQPYSNRTYTPFPSTTLFRSKRWKCRSERKKRSDAQYRARGCDAACVDISSRTDGNERCHHPVCRDRSGRRVWRRLVLQEHSQIAIPCKASVDLTSDCGLRRSYFFLLDGQFAQNGRWSWRE